MYGMIAVITRSECYRCRRSEAHPHPGNNRQAMQAEAAANAAPHQASAASAPGMGSAASAGRSTLAPASSL